MQVTISGNVEEILLSLDSTISPEGLVRFMRRDVDAYMTKRARNRFRSEGDDVVGKWAQLRPATVVIREREGFPGQHPINKRTGELEELLTERAAFVVPTAGGAYWKAMPAVPKGEIGKKLRTAQMGRAKPHTVRRPVLGMNENDLGAVLELLYFHVVSAE